MGTTDKPSKMNDIEHELHGVEDELQNFEERQVGVTRTLQMIVYPAMVAFIILSAYGFYLVQSLTTDVHLLTQTIADMHKSVDVNMDKISGTMDTMNGQMTSLVSSTNQMTNNIVGMNDSTRSMAGNVQQMNASTQNMAVSTYNMQRDMWSMNKNISGPMKMFNKFTPFGSDKTTPYVVPPPVVGMPYYNNYAWPQGTVAQPPAQQVQQAATPTTSVPETAPVADMATQQPVTEPGSVAEPVPAVAPGVGQPEGAATAKDEHSAVMPGMDVLATATAIATR